MRQPVFLARHFQTALGRQFLAFFGDDANGMGFVAQGNRLHFRCRRHLEIQRHFQNFHQTVDVGIRNMPPVFAQVGGDAVGACVFGQFGRAQRVRIASATCVAHCGDVINVNPKPQLAQIFPTHFLPLYG